MDQNYLIPDHILALAKTAEPPGEPFGWAEHDDHTVIVMRDGRKLKFPNLPAHSQAGTAAKTKTAKKRFEINMEDGVDEAEGSAAGKALRARKKEAKK